MTLNREPMVKSMELRAKPHRFVLIVEDERQDAELITELLQQCDGHIAVDVATNAEEGLAKVLKRPFDLIICDYCLPGMNGLSFLKVVKKTRQDIPILMLTGYPDNELEAQIIRHGSCTYLSKDAGRQTFLKVVNDVLSPLRDGVI